MLKYDSFVRLVRYIGIVKLFSFLDELSPPEVLFRIVRTLFSKKGEKEERSFPPFSP